jgi:hypothetical protein
MESPASFELARLQPILAAAGLDIDLRRADPVDQLIIRLAPDARGRRPELELLFVSDLLRHLDQVTGRESPPPAADDVDQLQFYVNLPFGVEPAAFGELARFVLLLNSGLPLTGLGIREADGAIYFRHLMMIVDHPVSERLVIETAGVIERILGRYREDLEAVAQGAKTLAEVTATG